MSELYSTSFSTATDFNLGLNNNGSAAELFSALTGLFDSSCDYATQNGYAVLFKDIACLVFEQIHPAASFH